MKRKNVQQSQHLTKSELGLMEVLWESDRPLTRPEILNKAVYNRDDPLFATNTFHVLVNSLIDKEYLEDQGAAETTRAIMLPQSPETSIMLC